MDSMFGFTDVPLTADDLSGATAGESEFFGMESGEEKDSPATADLRSSEDLTERHKVIREIITGTE